MLPVKTDRFGTKSFLFSPGVREEWSFLSTKLNSLNGKPMSPKSSTVGIVYSDASDSGFWGYLVQCGRENVSGSWAVERRAKH